MPHSIVKCHHGRGCFARGTVMPCHYVFHRVKRRWGWGGGRHQLCRHLTSRIKDQRSLSSLPPHIFSHILASCYARALGVRNWTRDKRTHERSKICNQRRYDTITWWYRDSLGKELSECHVIGAVKVHWDHPRTNAEERRVWTLSARHLEYSFVY